MPDNPLHRAPIYHQRNERLRGLVAAGSFQAGEKFFKEREVSEPFGVSRVTANKAHSQFVVAGLLEFHRTKRWVSLSQFRP